MAKSTWIDIRAGLDDLFSDLADADAQTPQMIMLMGGLQKTAAIQKLCFGTARTPGHSGDIRLSVDPETTRWESPVIFADCELHDVFGALVGLMFLEEKPTTTPCERRTTIVPLMRGGGPMAEGINDVFPLAMLVHASQPEDLKLHHVERQDSIILVDSVINTGKSILGFIEHVRKLRPTIRIVVVANVVQDKFISGETAANLARHGNISLIALRLSKNQFTGSGETDTGNRLFNTTHLA
ncbi:hypothetical protein VE00_06578 [Pseudogymnoascus sp. WSF 3629]|nr:hypothetical protein VE00_06578 [Pseudogymnoascus sp. WSF 3629]